MSTPTHELSVEVKPVPLADFQKSIVIFILERRSRDLHNYTSDNILVTVNESERVISKTSFCVNIDIIDLTNAQLVASCIRDNFLATDLDDFLSDEELDSFARQIAFQVTSIMNTLYFQNGLDLWIVMKKVETIIIDVHQKEIKPKPPSELSLSNLERLMFHGDDEACVVCREEFTSETKVTRMPCNHIFHDSCLLSWLQRKNSCPTCRYELDAD